MDAVATEQLQGKRSFHRPALGHVSQPVDDFSTWTQVVRIVDALKLAVGHEVHFIKRESAHSADHDVLRFIFSYRKSGTLSRSQRCHRRVEIACADPVTSVFWPPVVKSRDDSKAMGNWRQSITFDPEIYFIIAGAEARWESIASGSCKDFC